jgi:hypothetical protein
MLRDLLTQKSVDQKTVTDFRYPRACRFRKYQIENRLWKLPRPNFSKRDLNSQNVAKNGQYRPKLTDFQTFCGYFHVF